MIEVAMGVGVGLRVDVGGAAAITVVGSRLGEEVMAEPVGVAGFIAGSGDRIGEVEGKVSTSVGEGVPAPPVIIWLVSTSAISIVAAVDVTVFPKSNDVTSFEASSEPVGADP